MSQVDQLLLLRIELRFDYAMRSSTHVQAMTWHFTRWAGETEFYNRDGSLDRVTAHPSFRSTLTGPTGTITTADVGLDRFVENEDGTISIFGTGIHLKIKGGEKAIGLWRLVFDPETNELVSEEYHGRFDVDAEGTVQAICAALS